MDDDLAVVEEGKPGKDGDKKRQQLPEVNVERLGRGDQGRDWNTESVTENQ